MGPAPLSVVGFFIGAAFWVSFNLIMGVGEPWDHPLFWVGYLVANIGAAVLGALASSSAWVAGVAIIFAMLPVMVLFAGTGPLIVVGIILIVGLCIPAALSAAAGRYLAKKALG